MNAPNPLISCIVAAFNAERHLRDSLDSILAQRHHVDLEVIVVDDGSTDSTAAIAASYDDRLRLVQQPNGGQASAQNLGITQAVGTFITFMDADDLYPEDRFGAQLAAFEDDPELELCAGHVQNFRGNFQFLGEPVSGFNTDMLMRRALFPRVGLFAEELRHASKLEWMLRARKAGLRERLLPDTLIFRRMHGENMSLTDSNGSLREHLRTLHASIKGGA